MQIDNTWISSSEMQVKNLKKKKKRQNKTWSAREVFKISRNYMGISAFIFYSLPYTDKVVTNVTPAVSLVIAC